MRNQLQNVLGCTFRRFKSHVAKSMLSFHFPLSLLKPVKYLFVIRLSERKLTCNDFSLKRLVSSSNTQIMNHRHLFGLLLIGKMLLQGFVVELVIKLII